MVLVFIHSHGHWHLDERPARWADPESAIHDKHFWRVFETCLNHLPGRQVQTLRSISRAYTRGASEKVEVDEEPSDYKNS